MSHQKYETSADIAEERAAKELLRGMGYRVMGLPALSCADFIARKGGKSYIVEFKKRNFNHNKFPSAIIPHMKLQKILSAAEILGCEPIYVAKYDDGWYWCDLRSRYDLEVIQRAGRKHSALHARIDLTNFRRLV